MAVDPSIPRGIAPEGAIVVPPMRAPHPIITPIIPQPGFIAAASMAMHPVIAPGMVHPALRMEPHLMGAQFPFAMKPGRMNPFGEGPPMSEEEFYRIQKRMKTR